jgi:cytidylate kinase
LKPSAITIDGFAATGKSTVGALLAESLHYLYFDTGVMYRAATWAVLDRQVDPANLAEVSALAEQITIEVVADGPDDGRQNTILVDGQDVTWAIRQPAVDAHVSTVASYPRVRAVMTRQQRRIAAAGAIVMVGRDIGTVVLPEADLKIFLSASAKERARRRYEQALSQGQTANYEAILAAIIDRDRRDETNPVSPTKPAPDAIIIDTDTMSVAEVVAAIQKLVDAA